MRIHDEFKETNRSVAGWAGVPSLFPGKAWQQVLERDEQADGQFYYAMTSTKIYCRTRGL